jgi:magnesium chelatase family protein
MALFKAHSAAVYGIDAHLIDVESIAAVCTARDFITVGLIRRSRRAARDRPRSSIPASAIPTTKESSSTWRPANIPEGAGSIADGAGHTGAMGTRHPGRPLLVGEPRSTAHPPVCGLIGGGARARPGNSQLVLPIDNAAGRRWWRAKRPRQAYLEVMNMLQRPQDFTPTRRIRGVRLR